MKIPIIRTPKTSLNEMIKNCEKSVIMVTDFLRSMESITTQDKQVLKLYIDQIETSRSILTLLDNKRVFHIDTLLRSCLEQFIYLNAVISDPKTAYMYELYCAIEVLKVRYNDDKYKIGEHYIEDAGFEFNGVDYSVRRNDYEALCKNYNELFLKKSTNHMWYNLDGKTSGIAKLVKKLNLDSSITAIYSRLSIDVHSTTGNLQVQLILDEHGYFNLEDPFKINQVHDECVEFLLNSYNLVQKYYSFPIMHMEYNELSFEIEI